MRVLPSLRANSSNRTAIAAATADRPASAGGVTEHAQERGEAFSFRFAPLPSKSEKRSVTAAWHRDDDTQEPFPLHATCQSVPHQPQLNASFHLGSLVSQRADQAEELIRRIVYAATEHERAREIANAHKWLRQFGATEQAILGS